MPRRSSRPKNAHTGVGSSWGPPTASTSVQGELPAHSCCPTNEAKIPFHHSLASTTELHCFDLFREICLDVLALPPWQPHQRGKLRPLQRSERHSLPLRGLLGPPTQLLSSHDYGCHCCLERVRVQSSYYSLEIVRPRSQKQERQGALCWLLAREN